MLAGGRASTLFLNVWYSDSDMVRIPTNNVLRPILANRLSSSSKFKCESLANLFLIILSAYVKLNYYSFWVHLYNSIWLYYHWHSFSVWSEWKNFQQFKCSFLTLHSNCCCWLCWLHKLYIHVSCSINQADLIWWWSLIYYLSFFICLCNHLMGCCQNKQILFS